MTSQHDSTNHNHGEGIQLEPEPKAILQCGLGELLKLSEGLHLPHGNPTRKYPLPLSLMAYKEIPDLTEARADVEARIDSDPVSILENALVLLEAVEANAPDIAGHILPDGKFIGTCFNSKRRNGWIAIMGDADRGEIAHAIGEHWQFEFFNGPDRETGIYVLLNMLTKYAFIYGKQPAGDAHALSHFVEDHCPGVLVCCGKMSDLELALSLAAMKMGVPAVVPSDYPFPLGRTIRADSLDDIAQAVVGFANVRKLLSVPDRPEYPDYCNSDNIEQDVEPGIVWGDSAESFYIVRGGDVPKSETIVTGTPKGPMGIIVTLDAEPMDAFDCKFIERAIINKLALIDGVGVQYNGQDIRLLQAEGTNLDPQWIGEVLIAAVGKQFPKIKKIRVEVFFDTDKLAELAPQIAAEKQARKQMLDEATEESAEQFYACVGCSPFAPDHCCIITPQHPPMCGRPFAPIKTGAHDGYDDMSGIHHSKLHRDINSFVVIDKGQCLDETSGEWDGANRAVARLTHGRTTRVQLHSVSEFPATGCACFRMVMFETDSPCDGIGIMQAGYEGAAPDGRKWRDLHYALTGKQAPGLAGAAPGYLRSAKFLRAQGGWDAVVWVSEKIAALMGDDLPAHVQIGG